MRIASADSNLHRVQTKISYTLATEHLKREEFETDMDLIELLLNHILDPEQYHISSRFMLTDNFR